MITLKHGNLLEAEAEALVNTVNTVGVMGKGIALQFKKAYPDIFEDYKRACDMGSVSVGHMLVSETGELHAPKYVINFPTKQHWKERSRLEYVESGLCDLRDTIQRLHITSIAIPPLGCGNGGLDWKDVFPLIQKTFANLPGVQVLVYAPKGAPAAADMPDRTTRPRMTAARAAILGLMSRYGSVGYRLTLLEIQKLVYFLQVSGERLDKVEFARGKYGPYADTLRHVLSRMEGHFIQGYGDGANTPETSIALLPEAAREAETFLDGHAETRARFERVTGLIEGFETPYGMELLATVHWVATREDLHALSDANAAIEGVRAWSHRKKERFKPEHIETAWTRLRDQQWW